MPSSERCKYEIGEKAHQNLQELYSRFKLKKQAITYLLLIVEGQLRIRTLKKHEVLLHEISNNPYCSRITIDSEDFPSIVKAISDSPDGFKQKTLGLLITKGLDLALDENQEKKVELLLDLASIPIEETIDMKLPHDIDFSILSDNESKNGIKTKESVQEKVDVTSNQEVLSTEEGLQEEDDFEIPIDMLANLSRDFN